MAVGAQAGHLNDWGGDDKAYIRCCAENRAIDSLAGHFADHAATLADQKLGAVIGDRVRAGDVGVERGQAVHKPLLNKELKGAVDRDGGWAFPTAGHTLQDFVGTDGRVAVGDNFKDTPPLLGQSNPSERTQLCGGRENRGDT